VLCRRMLRSDLTMAVEFRCASWLAQGSGDEDARIPAANCTPGAMLPSYAREDVLAWLRRYRMAFVIADEFLEEWPDADGDNSATNNGRLSKTVSFSRGGPPPIFLSSHSLVPSSSSLSSPSSSTSSSPSSDVPASSGPTAAVPVSPIAALGFQLSSRLLKERHVEEEEEEGSVSAAARPQRRRLQDAEADRDEEEEEGNNSDDPSRRRQPNGQSRAGRSEERREQAGPVERKVRMVPIVERVTKSVGVLRAHPSATRHRQAADRCRARLVGPPHPPDI
jgi:hypothetical protein